MVVYIFYILAFLLLLRANNKVLITLSYFLMIILFCFNLTNADREIYENRLANYDSMIGLTETGYYYLMELFTKCNLDIQYLYIYTGFFYLSTLFYITSKLSKNQGIVISSYMIGAFLLDVVQLRFTLSLTFVLWGFYYMLSVKSMKFRILLFSSFIVIATLFHSSSLIYLAFGVAFFRKELFYKLLGVAFICIVSFFSILVSFFGELYEMGKKIDGIQNSDRYVGNNSNLLCLIYLILFILMYLIPYKKYFREQKERIELSSIWYKVILSCVLIIPTIPFSADVRRIFIGLLPIQVSVISHWSTPRNSFFIKAIVIGISLLFLYFFILRSLNIKTVFYPIFEKNMLL